MKVVAEYKHSDSEDVWDYTYYPYQPIFTINWGKVWRMYFCPVCTEISVERDSWDNQTTYPNGETIIETEFIYPVNKDVGKYYPKEVKDALDAALKVRNLDGAICVLALRRALEKMCKSQNANGRDLFSKLKDLQDRKVLPHIMEQITYVLRKEGNSAAHADEVEFDKETVDQMIEFTRTTLDYVYTLPKKIELAQEKLKRLEKDQSKVEKGKK